MRPFCPGPRPEAAGSTAGRSGHIADVPLDSSFMPWPPKMLACWYWAARAAAIWSAVPAAPGARCGEVPAAPAGHDLSWSR